MRKMDPMALFAVSIALAGLFGLPNGWNPFELLAIATLSTIVIIVFDRRY